jgi:hypothetical protein
MWCRAGRPSGRPLFPKTFIFMRFNVDYMVLIAVMLVWLRIEHRITRLEMGRPSGFRGERRRFYKRLFDNMREDLGEGDKRD